MLDGSITLDAARVAVLAALRGHTAGMLEDAAIYRDEDWRVLVVDARVSELDRGERFVVVDLLREAEARR
jgi:alpha-D-ribose 1-methylphosphonate 5-triphosphate synthase subunit PhnL